MPVCSPANPPAGWQAAEARDLRLGAVERHSIGRARSLPFGTARPVIPVAASHPFVAFVKLALACVSAINLKAILR